MAREDVPLDQETLDRVLADELAKGTDRRVAEGRAKSAALRAERAKTAEGPAAPAAVEAGRASGGEGEAATPAAQAPAAAPPPAAAPVRLTRPASAH